MKGVLYGVGVGPGDPSLITLKAIETINRAAVIAVPDTGGEKNALNIVEQYTAGKELLLCSMPMTRDAELLNKSHEKSADLICSLLDEGKDVAFITLGDPSIYSTYMYIHRLVLQRGYLAKMIPGVPSFCAAAAAFGTSLCEGGEALHIFPASYDGLEENLGLTGGKVLMKTGRKMAQVQQALKKFNLYEKARVAECCGMANEKLYENIEDAGEGTSYFSIIIIKDNE
jgi:precorrin-2/cobalt-factor-2 C20-methyltransferase